MVLMSSQAKNLAISLAGPFMYGIVATPTGFVSDCIIIKIKIITIILFLKELFGLFRD